MKDVIYFRLNNGGETINGYVKISDALQLLKSKGYSSMVEVYSRGFVTRYRWDLIKNTIGMQEYIKEHLPEYTI